MTSVPRPTFRLVLTADFFDDHGHTKFADLGTSLLEGQSHVELAKLPEFRPTLTANQLANCHGAIVLTPKVASESVTGCEDLLAIGRFGVGYDSVDVAACTAQDVLVMITTGAVDRPVAEATIGWMIALSHHMFVKDRLVRTGQWSGRTNYMGCELRDRTLGVIGLGGIGRTLVSLLKGFSMQPPIAFDPFAPSDVFDELGVRSVPLEELLSTADFVSIHCPLTEETRGLIGENELRQMKRGAYLINTARGGIVDEGALFDALKSGQLRGAALDCFENEPLTEPHPLGELENVLLAPHSIAWTNELFRDIGRTACQSMLDLSIGRSPHGVVNRELLQKPSFREKWSRVTGVRVEELS